jgi:Zn-dependent peptidase ImmA (M78 family)/DNA-binding XRE family transcriptional regulator
MENIIGNKIKSARIIGGLSQEDVAVALGISKQMISKYEKGLSLPTSTNLLELAKALKVNIDFFFSAPALDLGQVNFRKKSTFSVKKQQSLTEQIKASIGNYIEIEDILQINYSDVLEKSALQVSALEDVEEAAIRLREAWNIGIDPIHNLIQLLEDHEIKVLEIDEATDAFDGLACKVNGNIPVIVVNKNFPLERKRFTLAHELGHLLLRLSPYEEVRIEKYCNRFAGAFLFPAGIVAKEFGTKRAPISLPELIEVQKKYGMSIRAIMYRLKDSGIITESRHEQFYKKINANQQLKKEVDRERCSTPEYSHRFEQLVYRALSQELISGSKAASYLNLSLTEVLQSTAL